MDEKKSRSQFPRSRSLPSQSSQYWCKEKDRYIRQLLIDDIEEDTGRELVVYYCRLDQSISEPDGDDLSEILQGATGSDIDIMLHTSGGDVDAVEKVITVLKHLKPEYRVIIPSWAKSGGTLIALASKKILLGVNSELGPVDPQIYLPDFGYVPAEHVSKDDSQPKLITAIAADMFERAKKLAEKYLKEGMLAGEKEKLVPGVLAKLSSATGYGSHGAVIDYHEALSLGLDVEWMQPEDDFWRRVWLLHCLYKADAVKDDLGKIFEGSKYSISRKPSLTA